jgi:soluble lytic murein transglycosylase-like protein
MGTLSRSYGRQVKPLNLTLVPYWAVALMPAVLAIVLASLALKLMKQANSRIIDAARPEISSMAQTNDSINQNSVYSGELALFSPEVRAWESEIHRWSEDHDLPPSLVAIVMQIESCGAPQVKSSAGAMGLFQVMPFHFSTQEDPFDPETNAGRGLQYLARAYKLAGGSIDNTLAGYNGGHSVINLDPNNWPEETRRYVKWGTGIWTDLQSGEMRSDTLNQWLGAGGEHLCQKARE